MHLSMVEIRVKMQQVTIGLPVYVFTDQIFNTDTHSSEAQLLFIYIKMSVSQVLFG